MTCPVYIHDCFAMITVIHLHVAPNTVFKQFFVSVGIVELMEDLDKDYDNTKIIDLCQCEGETFKLKCFEAADPLYAFADHFLIMMTNKSNLFIRPLEKKMRQVVNTSSESTIADIHPLIWKPTFDHCQQLLKSLTDQTIMLADVDKHFKPFAVQLETQVKILADGIGECVKMPPNQPGIQLALRQVRNYWKLCEYRNGADVFLRLRDVLNLHNGDFKDVERFATEVLIELYVSVIGQNL